MKLIKYPKKTDWAKLACRPVKETAELENIVKTVFNDVINNGDKALIDYTLKFDKVLISSLKISQEEIAKSENLITDELKASINLAVNNVKTFHKSQLEEKRIIETSEGVYCWRENRAIQNVGIYIPGGTAPLFSTVIMLAVPARLAGCSEIVLCTPPAKDGKINPAILYTAKITGVTSVYCVGGIQAVAAMTFGTESISKVDKIFGPGNQYVTAAKQMAQNYGVAIDMPAGPSEVLVIADESALPEFVASDLLSQAEHGDDSQVILLSTSEDFLIETMQRTQEQLKKLPRKESAEKSLESSLAILFETIDDCIDFSNLYAPEHLIIATNNYKELSKKIINAGSVFLGNFSCESAGDYASGTNHTLPTNGYARNYSGVSLDSFIKKITFQELSKEGIKNIGPAIEIMAAAEDLEAHKNAVSIRLKYLNNENN